MAINPNSVTIPDLVSMRVGKELAALIFAARYEHFEDGFESNFSRGLVELIERHGNEALDEIAQQVLDGRVNIEAGAEALRWIGKIENPATYESRRHMLERCLLHSNSARVRDGALLGLASMDDPNSIPVVEQAIKQETVSELRDDLKQLLDQLAQTAAEKAV